MQIKKLLSRNVVRIMTGAVFPFALLGCPDKAAGPKPDPAAASAKPATTAPGGPAAAPAKSGSGW
jgi:hypothetical protein